MHNYHILVIDDNAALLQTLKLVLKHEFRTVGTISSPTLIPAVLNNGGVDAVLLDMNFSNRELDCSEGIFWLQHIKSRPDAPAVILMTAFGNIEVAVRSMKDGADDFVTKPWDNKILVEKIVAAIEKKRTLTCGNTVAEEESETLEDVERKKLLDVLETYGSNITKCASILGISRRTLYNKIKKYGL